LKFDELMKRETDHCFSVLFLLIGYSSTLHQRMKGNEISCKSNSIPSLLEYWWDAADIMQKRNVWHREKTQFLFSIAI